VDHDGIRKVALSVLVEQDRDDMAVEPDGLRLKSLDATIPWGTLSLICPPTLAFPARSSLVTDLLSCAVWVRQPIPVLQETVRVHAQPTGSRGAPGGDTWAVEAVHGGVLNLGWGATGVDPARSGRVVPIADLIWVLAGVDAWSWWGAARARHERDGELCALRWATGVLGKDELRTVLGHDVVTLLGARSLREALTGRLGSPMVSVGCPTRSTAWLVHGGVDPSFVTLAFNASEVSDRAFAHPLLVTVDEVAHPSGRPSGAPV
jgi:hypothetical protein